MAGGTPAAYEFGLAADSTPDGLPVASLRARAQTEELLEAASFGTMMQSVSAHRYRGTRLRLAGLGLAIVDETIGVTTGRGAIEIPDSPQNLDFVVGPRA